MNNSNLTTSELIEKVSNLVKEREKLKKKNSEIEKLLTVFKTAFDASGISQVIVDEDGTICMVNHNFEKLSGFSKDEIVGTKMWVDFVDKKYLEMMKKYRDARLRGEEWVPREYEFWFKNKAGKVIHVYATVSVIPGTKKIVATLVDMTEKIKARKKLERHLELEKTVSKILERFVGEEDYDKSINLALKDIGETREVSRAYIFLCHDDCSQVSVRYEWTNEGVSRRSDKMRQINTSDIKWWIEKLKKKETIYIEDVSKMPDEAKTEREILMKFGVKSLLVFPIFVKSKLYGFVGFHDIFKTDAFDKDDFHILSIFADILGRVFELIETKKKLREQEHLFEEVFKILPVSIQIYDKHGRPLMMNEETLKIFGIKHEEEFYKKFNLFSVLSLNKKEKEVVYSGGMILKNFKIDFAKARNKYYRCTRNDEAYIKSYVTAIFDEEGKITNFIGVSIETTEEKRHQEQLKIEKIKYKSIIDTATDGICLVDNNFNIIECNQAFLKLFNYSRTEVIGKSLLMFLKSFGNLNDLNGKITTGKILSMTLSEIDGVAKDGRILKIEASFGFFKQNDNKYITVILRDITKRKKLEEKLKTSMNLLRKSIGGIIEAMARTVEVRDPYTAGHQKRVSDLARAIATEMGLPSKQIEGIRIAASIHDIGKIAVPSEILSKPGRLTEIEFNLIRTHPSVGFEILKNIEFPFPVARMVLEHHERINGSGYPNHLKGDEILLESRIIAVADVVEAISSFRPYRPALGVDVALKEISDRSGELYDKDVVKACLRVFTAKGFHFK